MNKRKSTSKTRPKAASQEEQIWKEHVKNLLRNSSKVTNKPITKIINSLQDIKLWQFMEEELNVVLTKIKSRKAAGLDKILPEVKEIWWLTSLIFNTVYKQNTTERWTKSCILLFPKKGDLRITKNYKGVTFTSIAAKVYYALLLNRIEPKIEQILRKNQNGFRWKRSTSQILTIRCIIERVRAKNLKTTQIVYRFLKGFWFHTQWKEGVSSWCNG